MRTNASCHLFLYAALGREFHNMKPFGVQYCREEQLLSSRSGTHGLYALCCELNSSCWERAKCPLQITLHEVMIGLQAMSSASGPWKKPEFAVLRVNFSLLATIDGKFARFCPQKKKKMGIWDAKSCRISWCCNEWAKAECYSTKPQLCTVSCSC